MRNSPTYITPSHTNIPKRREESGRQQRQRVTNLTARRYQHRAGRPVVRLLNRGTVQRSCGEERSEVVREICMPFFGAHGAQHIRNHGIGLKGFAEELGGRFNTVCEIHIMREGSVYA